MINTYILSKIVRNQHLNRRQVRVLAEIASKRDTYSYQDMMIKLINNYANKLSDEFIKGVTDGYYIYVLYCKSRYIGNKLTNKQIYDMLIACYGLLTFANRNDFNKLTDTQIKNVIEELINRNYTGNLRFWYNRIDDKYKQYIKETGAIYV